MIECKDRPDLLRQRLDRSLADLTAAAQKRAAANMLQSTLLRHTCTVQRHTHSGKHRASQLGFSRGTLISTEQTLQVMGMFSGCYLVLCGNEIASHLYHHPQTQEGPWPLLQQGPLRLPGDTNQLAAEKITLPGNWKHCKRNDWQEIGRSLKVWV